MLLNRQPALSTELLWICLLFILHYIFLGCNSYRVGGDEFVIIEQNIERDKYEERITALKNIMQDKQVSISIGVLWREQVDDLEALLKTADKLMYMEKEMYHKNRE